MKMQLLKIIYKAVEVLSLTMLIFLTLTINATTHKVQFLIHQICQPVVYLFIYVLIYES